MASLAWYHIQSYCMILHSLKSHLSYINQYFEPKIGFQFFFGGPMTRLTNWCPVTYSDPCTPLMTSWEILESQALLFKKILVYAAYIRMSPINRTRNYTLPSAYPNAQDLTQLARIKNSWFLDHPNLISILWEFFVGFLIFGLPIMQAIKLSTNTQYILTRISCYHFINILLQYFIYLNFIAAITNWLVLLSYHVILLHFIKFWLNLSIYKNLPF